MKKLTILALMILTLGGITFFALKGTERETILYDEIVSQDPNSKIQEEEEVLDEDSSEVPEEEEESSSEIQESEDPEVDDPKIEDSTEANDSIDWANPLVEGETEVGKPDSSPEEIEEIVDLSLQSITTSTALSINVVDYSTGKGMGTYQIYDAIIIANFGDASSLGKKVEITIPEGIRYVAYPVLIPSAGT